MKDNKTKLTNKTKLLIYEYKERYPILSAQDISDMVNLSQICVEDLFKKGELIVSSKMNN